MHKKSISFFAQKSVVANKEGATIIKGVVIAQQGVDKMGEYMSSDFIADLVAKGNAQPQGVKARFGHPNACKTTLGSYIGRYKNFRVENNNAVADLHLAELSKKTNVEGRNISMHDYIVEMARDESDMFGNSIVFRDGGGLETLEIDGEEREIWNLKCEELLASDVVDSPAATTSLFKDSDDLGVIVTNFLNENPSIFEAVSKDESILQGFITRYKNYLNQKDKMGILEKVKSLFVETAKELTQTTADGVMIVFDTEADNIAVGDSATIEGETAPDGDYLMADDSTVTIEGGVVTAIETPEEEETEEPEMVEESTDNDDALKSLKEDLMIELKEMREAYEVELGELKESLKESNQTIEFLAGQIKSPSPEAELNPSKEEKKDKSII